MKISKVKRELLSAINAQGALQIDALYREIDEEYFRRRRICDETGDDSYVNKIEPLWHQACEAVIPVRKVMICP